jgi:hypothetical protein
MMRIGKYYNNVQGKCYEGKHMTKFQVLHQLVELST